MSWRPHSSGWTTSAFHPAPSVQMGTTPGTCPELAACFPILIYNSCWIDLCLQFSRQLCPVLPERSNWRFPPFPLHLCLSFIFPPFLSTPVRLFKRNDWGVSVQCVTFISREEWTVDTRNSVDGPEGHFTQWKKPVSKAHILSDPVSMMFLKWCNYQKGEEISGCWGSEYKGVAKGRRLWWWKSSVFWTWNSVHRNVHIW